MNITVIIEHRFARTADGAVWTETQFAYPFWMRYLEVFDRVRVVARIRDIPSASADWRRADGERVTFAAVPYYLGPWQYIQRVGQVRRATRQAVGDSDAIIMRVSSTIANQIEPLLQKTGRPYGLEVVGDPYDVFAPGSVRHPLRPLFRWWFPRRLRRQCLSACATAYVTQHALQQRYPPSASAFSTYYSNVELSQTAFVSDPRPLKQRQQQFILITVGTLAQLYKAPDVLIDAVASCVSGRLDLRLVIVGDGKHRSELEARAERLGLSERVLFRGQLPAGDAVRAELDQADVFILPSYQEGLPRAMVEAMARALPCIGSTVGGIPELLPTEDLVPPGDAQVLARKIREMIADPRRMEHRSMRNLEKAREYAEESLCERRNLFYQYVREKTETWLERRKQ